MRLINADAAKAELRKDCQNCAVNGSSFCKTECIINRRCDFLDDQPTVERPHGRWSPETLDGFARCSECNCVDIFTYPFCPNCGSDMREEVNNGTK